MVVPYAFSMKALVTRQKGAGWLRSARRWTLITWLFQGGRLLELGSGGEFLVPAVA
jgi:cytochrome c biogenesis factor